jgi:hypothetical protein
VARGFQPRPGGPERAALQDVKRLRASVRYAAATCVIAAILLAAADPRAAVAPDPRRGAVVLSGRALADQDGPFLALGATLFWALWGEANDPERLDANLAWLADRGVHYVRILGMVGGESWSDRRIDPTAPDYWTIVDRLLVRLGRHGLRAQVTIFAGAQAMMPDRGAREAFVDRWAARVNREPDRFVLLEIANEHYQNGLDDILEVRALGRRLADRTAVLVALSAPADGQACAMYAGSAADLATIHYPRNFQIEGPWQALGRPWHYPNEYDSGCRGALPVAVNNEPIGPASSVADDSDPLRLVLAYVTTFLSQNAAHVVHAGAGIRGGGAADRVLGRRANLFEVPGLDAALRGMQAAQSYLPSDLSNWTREDAAGGRFPFAGLDRAIERGDVKQAYAAIRQDRFVLVVLGLKRPLQVTARTSVVIEIIDPVSGTTVGQMTVRAGDPIQLEPRPRDEWGDGLLLISQ